MEEEQRLRRVLLIYRAMIPSVRLCGHCQMEYLAQAGQIEYRAIQENKLKRADLNWADIVLLGRLDSWYERKLVEKLHQSGRYLIYIIDDDLLNIPEEISSAAYYNQKSIQRNIRSMIELSDAIMSPSPLLLQKYATDGRKAIRIEEPALDPVPYSPHDPSKPVKIGFAGSIDRTGDIESILKDALIRIKKEFGSRVQIEFFGAIPSFAAEVDARCIPYCDSYDDYRKTLNHLEWDIGLAPMPDTPFHACKHYNKFIEYGAAGMVGIYSSVEPYAKLRNKDFFIGKLCNNKADNWYEAIFYLIDHINNLDTQRAAVCIVIEKELRLSVVSVNMYKQIEQLKLENSNPNDNKVHIMSLTLLKVGMIFAKTLSFVRSNGRNTPIRLINKISHYRHGGRR